MMAYIGCGDSVLTANRCTSRFTSVFVDLWSKAKMSQSERVFCFIRRSGRGQATNARIIRDG
jgi:hypothetical protein